MRTIMSIIGLFVSGIPLIAADWPQWLGANRNGSSSEKVTAWKEAPKVAWRISVGEGHSSPIIVGDRVFLHSKGEGNTEVVAWTAVDDFGTVINPMIVEGQVHGGIAQGIGQALYEGTVYDKDGQLMTGSYMDYAMPRADYLPSFKVDTTETKCPSNPLGIKGCGEAGAIAAPAAVMNAITDAVGTEHIAMPATPATVWAALQKTQPRQAAE